MAKRKRLSPDPRPAALPAGIETKSMPFGSPAPAQPPIARVAGEASASAALDALGDMVSEARAEGRLLEALPLEAVETGYLMRDRLEAEADGMAALMSSIRQRGQTTPIEVVALENGHYGLISGWRRMLALSRLATEDSRFGTVVARVITPEDASQAYLAMVEENEIREGLTPWERAQIVVRALDGGIFETERAALQTLYGNITAPRRSRIGSLVGVVRALGDHIRYPRALSERQGLALAKALNSDETAQQRLIAALTETSCQDAEEEMALLLQAASPPPASPAPPPSAAVPRSVSEAEVGTDPGPDWGLRHDAEAGLIEIEGSLVDDALRTALERFLTREAARRAR